MAGRSLAQINLTDERARSEMEQDVLSGEVLLHSFQEQLSMCMWSLPTTRLRQTTSSTGVN